MWMDASRLMISLLFALSLLFGFCVLSKWCFVFVKSLFMSSFVVPSLGFFSSPIRFALLSLGLR